MARYSKIDRRIWSDQKFRLLSRPQPCGQALFLYLLTNPAVGPIPGIYCAGEAMLAEALGWSLEGFREAFQEAFREGLVKADFHARLIWIPNAINYNQPENPNVVKAWQNPWDELPECDLKDEARKRLRLALNDRGKEWVIAFDAACPGVVEGSTSKGIAKDLPKGPRNSSSKGMPNQEQEQKQEQVQEQTCAKPCGSAPAPPVSTLPLNDDSEFPIFQEQVSEWSSLFPSVQVMQELRNMRVWCIANPARRKTKAGILRFVVKWLSKEQDNPKVTIGRSAHVISKAELRQRRDIDDLRQIVHRRREGRLAGQPNGECVGDVPCHDSDP
jgi:hypothetical protein